jgi:hypothetical protein
MGHRIAFGNTAEHYRCRCKVLGCEARGDPEQGPLRPSPRYRIPVWNGWPSMRGSQYRDALSRRTKVCLMLVESLGGIYYSSKLQLHTLAKRQKRVVGVSAVDRSRYGRATASPQSFMQHAASLPTPVIGCGNVGCCRHLQEDECSQVAGLSYLLSLVYPPPLLQQLGKQLP